MKDKKYQKKISIKHSKFKTYMKYFLIMTFSGYFYVTLELIFRGRSDVTMMYCASIAGLVLCLENNIFSYDLDFIIQIIMGAVSCTGCEWIFGRLFNQDFKIWDYRNMPFHSPDGQICLPFFFVWVLISIICIPLLDYIEWRVFNYRSTTPPYYKVCGKKIFQFKK